MRSLPVLFACLVLWSCRDNRPITKNSWYPKGDSLTLVLSKDTITHRKHSLALHALRVLNLDTVTKAKCYLYAAVSDTVPASRTAYLDSVVQLSSALKQSDAGRTPLIKAFRHQLYDCSCEGKFEDVVKVCEQALVSSTAGLDSVNRSIFLSQMAAAYERLGDTRKALSSNEAAVAYALSIKDSGQVADACINLSVSQIIAKNEVAALTTVNLGLAHCGKASTTTKELLRLSQIDLSATDQAKLPLVLSLIKTAEEDYAKFSAHKMLAEIYLRQGNFAGVIETTKQGIKYDGIEPREFAKMWLANGTAALKLEQLQEANIAIDSGLARLGLSNDPVQLLNDSVEAENTVFDLCALRAQVLLHKNENDSTKLIAALNNLLVARKVSGQLRKTLLYDESKIIQSADISLVTELLLDTYYRLYKSTGNEAYAKAALVFIDNNKSLALLDNVQNSVLSAADDSGYANFLNLSRKMADLEVKLLEASTDAEKASLKKQMSSIDEELSAYKALRGAFAQAEPKISFDELQQYCTKNQCALVHFFALDYLAYELALVNGKVSFLKHDKAVIDSVKALQELQKNAAAWQQQQLRFCKLSHGVYQQLFAPLEFGKTAKIVLCTDGTFTNIAYDALHTSLSPTDFLVLKIQVNLAYSVSTLLQQAQRAYASENNTSVFAPFSNSSRFDLPALSATQQEAQQVQKINSAQVQLAQQANFKNFEAINNIGCLHLATHAIGGKAPCLYLHDTCLLEKSMYARPMICNVVYLNMCESANGQLVSTEGSLSHARTFYSNGAHNVVHSFWNIDDNAAKYIATAFYKLLKTSCNNSAAALCQAKRQYLQTTSPDEQAPYYWSCMQHLGDGQIETAGGFGKWWLWAVGASVIGLVLWFVRRR
jgi:CHAT domain-containing protein